jgi:hypothetical protein
VRAGKGRAGGTDGRRREPFLFVSVLHWRAPPFVP